MSPQEKKSTEEKIKQAARAVFIRKGYAGTKTRDIADEAGENLALINYYFRSKENLFRTIMTETMVAFIGKLVPVLTDETTSFEAKIELIVANYINILKEQPELAIFIMNEIQTNPDLILGNMPSELKLLETAYFRQLQEKFLSGHIAPIHPAQLILNIFGLTIFPFVGRPMIKGVFGVSDEDFNELLEERKTLVPIWINKILKP